MNRRYRILLAVAVTTLAITCSAKAQTIQRKSPTSEAVSVLESGGTVVFEARCSGLIWPWQWHAAEWYVDGELKKTEGLSGQTAETSYAFPRTPVGTHEVKVRAKYDTVPFGIHAWTRYQIWTVTVVSPDTYTVERMLRSEQSTEIVHNVVGCGAQFGGIVSQATWQQVEWYTDGVLYSTGALSEGPFGYISYIHPTFTIGTHEVKVRAKWSLGGEEVWTDYMTWTIEVVPHPPTASCVAPSSPVSVVLGGTQAFTARGTDVGGIEHYLEIAEVRWYIDGVLQSDVEIGNIPAPTVDNTWSHTFDTEGTYQVEAVFYDHEGYSSASGQAVWTVVVEQQYHEPSATIVSPGSPVAVYAGGSVTFKVTGTDAGNDLRLCEVLLDDVPQTNTSFSGAASGSIAAWTHTFNTPGTYRVAFVPLDLANSYGTEVVWIVVVKADPGQAGLSGMVIELDAQGRARGPLAGAEVDLTGPAAGTATTDGQGKFAFAGLNPGTYTANVGKTRFYAQSRGVSLAAGETKDEVFRLTPESPEPAAFDFSLPNGKHFFEGMPGGPVFLRHRGVERLTRLGVFQRGRDLAYSEDHRPWGRQGVGRG